MPGLLGLKVLTLATWCYRVGHSGVDFLLAEHRTNPTPTLPSPLLPPVPLWLQLDLHEGWSGGMEGFPGCLVLRGLPLTWYVLFEEEESKGKHFP